jgi:hypothetical protein
VVSSFSSTSASVLVPTLGVEDEDEEEEEDTSSVRGREGEGSDGRVSFPALWAITSSGKKTGNGWAGWRGEMSFPNLESAHERCIPKEPHQEIMRRRI